MNGPALWSCRSCCQKESRTYQYPPQPDVYCATCSQPMSLREQEVTVQRLLLRSRPVGVPTAAAEVVPTAPPPLPHEPELLSADEAAKLLRTSRKAIYAMAERRQLPGLVRVGRRIRVRRAVLLDWLAQEGAPSLEKRR